ncbi:hypothetical protein ACKVEX_15040 [Rhodocyclaceae bacterium SMB388]
MFQTYGANPSPMALSEVFVAVQTGGMDGQDNPFTQIYSSKFQETPGVVRSPAPMLGQHTREILEQHGLSETEIGLLVAEGAIELGS